MLCFGWWVCIRPQKCRSSCVTSETMACLPNASSGVKRQISFRMRVLYGFKINVLDLRGSYLQVSWGEFYGCFELHHRKTYMCPHLTCIAWRLSGYSPSFLHLKMIVYCLRFFNCADYRCLKNKKDRLSQNVWFFKKKTVTANQDQVWIV